MRALRLALFTSILALAPAAPAGERSPAPGFRLISHPGNPTTVVDRKFVADAFLKKVTRWPSDEVIRPVDLDPDSPVRRRFSEEVLKRSVSAIKSYWQQLIFAGRDLPPPELDSDADVIRFVQHHAGAIGYVSPNASIEGTRALELR